MANLDPANFTALIALLIALLGIWRADVREEKSRKAADIREEKGRKEALELRKSELRRFLVELLFDHMKEGRIAYNEAALMLQAQDDGFVQEANKRKAEFESSLYDLLNDKVMKADTVEDFTHVLRSICESASDQWDATILRNRILKGR